MRNTRLTIQFDGTAYHGWQRQANAPTVQETLESALAKMLGYPVIVRGCSRTDAGVHAEGHVSSFFHESAIPEQGFLLGLNSALPRDIAVRSVTEMPLSFSAKTHSESKTYRYQIYLHQIRQAFCHYHWHVFRPLNVDAMRIAALSLVGEHDFTSFRASGCDAKHPIRHIHRLALTANGDELLITVVGNAFLRQMVRNIVGTLVEVGRGRRPPEWVGEVLEAKDRRLAGPTAPAKGLFLQSVSYPAPY